MMVQKQSQCRHIGSMVLFVALYVASSYSQQLQDGHAAAPEQSSTASVEALAQQLGVQPHVLMTASRLAARQPQSIVQLLSVNPSATLTDSGAIVFGCDLRPHAHTARVTDEPDSHTHAGSPSTPAQQQQQEQQEQQPAGLDPVPPQGLQVWDETDLSHAFRLHSRPTATKKIYLAFDGCVTEGTEGWNRYYNISRIETPPYDVDGHMTDFSDAERQDIITIHAGVAEAYAPWDVDVTTEDPGFEGIERSDEHDEHYGIRMCVGGTSEWTGTRIGGIATLNSFGWINNGTEVYRDAFAFSMELTDRDKSINLGFIWKTIAHEIGHTLGLVHKGYKTKSENVTHEYYTIPPGTTLWGPTMGVPGMALFAQWSKGEYPEGFESTNFDDELSTITKTLDLLPDEGGSSPWTAKDLCSKNTAATCTPDPQKPGWVSARLEGRISHPEDTDWFKVHVATTKPFAIQLTVHDNYRKSVTGENGTQRPVTWRVSNLRPTLTFAHKGVKVVSPTLVDAFTWQQEFIVTVPHPGHFCFAVQPSTLLNSSDGQALHTTYGLLGSYQISTSWPDHHKTT